jgi:hypothetical protein
VTDKQLNEYIGHLLDVPKEKRLTSDGWWSEDFDCAMAMWENLHPGTRPPAFENVGPPPSCFAGTVPPIYDGELK